MECYACTNQATKQCRRCARVYCEVHGGDLCAECLSPASSLPSFNLYRGSLLALLVGTAVAVWLLVRPPGEGSNDNALILGGTPSTSVATRPSNTVVRRTATAPATPTPPPPATATPTAPAPPPTAPQPQQYTVQEGDTLSDVAAAYGTTPEAIAAASGISADDPISPGQVLTIPP